MEPVQQTARTARAGARVGLALGALMALVVLSPGAARADNYEEFGFGPRAQAMGGAFTGLASDATATYYNPAGLVLSRHLNLTFGYSFADYHLDFDSQRGGELDDQAERIPDLSALTLGISTTIPVDVPDRVGFGLSVFIPTRGIIDVEAKASTDQPEWFRYGSRHDRIHIIPALALKVTNWLSIGAGASVFVDAVGGTTLSAGLTAPVNPEFKLKLKPDAGVVFGFLLTPADTFSFGLTYRSEQSFKLDFPAVASVQGITIPLELEAITFFTPHQVQMGIAWNATDATILTLDLLWANWSAYEDPFLVVSSNVAGVIPRQRVDFRDTWSPRLGVEVAANDWLLLRGGYFYRTSAVPDQDDEVTNLVGGDKHVFTLGAGFSFGKPPERLSDEAQADEGRAETMKEALVNASFDLDLFFQLHWHPEVSASKPPTDPVGDWDAGGFIVNFGFALTSRF